jgi:hypothetical protein
MSEGDNLPQVFMRRPIRLDGDDSRDDGFNCVS